MAVDESLSGRVALVTGAGRPKGLGAGIAAALSGRGATVVCADIVDATSVADGLPGPGSGRAVDLDVTDSDAVQATVDAIVDADGSLDILAANAGVVHPLVATVTLPDDVVQKVLDVNVKGVLACARAATGPMRARGHGRIVMTSSSRGRIAWPNMGAYNASKAAVLALAQTLALELAADGITVNAVCPGTMWTDMSEGAFTSIAAEQGVDIQTLKAEKVKDIPVGRWGTPEDVGAAVAYLAGDEASFVTGAFLNLTGGEDLF